MATHVAFLVPAERKYALALGRYERAEQATETIVGLKALEEADKGITAEKAKLKATLERIAANIRRFYPDWTPAISNPFAPTSQGDEWVK